MKDLSREKYVKYIEVVSSKIKSTEAAMKRLYNYHMMIGLNTKMAF